MQLMMSFLNGMRAAAETRGVGMLQQHYIELDELGLSENCINESSELGFGRNGKWTRLANRRARLAKRETSCKTRGRLLLLGQRSI